MSEPNSDRKRFDRNRVLMYWPSVIQIVFTLVISVTLWLALDVVSAKSALLGGMVVIIPYLYFAARMQPLLGKSDSGKFLRAIAIAEIGKLILTAVCCAVVFVWVKPLSGLAFFASMVVVYFSGHMSLIFVIRHTT